MNHHHRPWARTRLLPAAVVIALLTGGGCATLKRSEVTAWNGPSPSVDAHALSAHQALLMLKAGETAEQQGRIDEAIRLYEQARALDPQQNHLCRRLAVLHDQQGDTLRAEAAFTQAMALSPDDSDLLNDKGVHYVRRSQGARAEDWFRRAIAVQPNHQRATNNLAMSLAMQGRLNESYDAFSSVVGPAAAYSNLGVLLARQGRNDEARDHFQRALAMDKTLHPAGEFLSRLDSSSAPISPSPSGAAIQPVSYERETVRHRTGDRHRLTDGAR